MATGRQVLRLLRLAASPALRPAFEQAGPLLPMSAESALRFPAKEAPFSSAAKSASKAKAAPKSKAKAKAKAAKPVPVEPKPTGSKSPFAVVRRPPSALSLFVKDKYASYKKAELKPKEVLAQMARDYKVLAADEKQKYEAEAAKRLAEVREQRAKIKADLSAKRAKTPYVHYFMETMKGVVEETPAMRQPERAKIVAERWRKLTDAEKQKYVDKAEAERKEKGLPAKK